MKTKFKIVIPFHAYEPQYLKTPIVHYEENEKKARKLFNRLLKAHSIANNLHMGTPDIQLKFVQLVLEQLGLFQEGTFVDNPPKLYKVTETEIK